MICFLGFAYKFVVSSIFKKNDLCGCGFIKPNGMACGLETLATAEGTVLPTCQEHAFLYCNAIDVILMEPQGDNLHGKFRWDVVEKPLGMVLYS